MKIAFVAGFSPIVRDPATSRAFSGDAIGLAFEGGEGDYVFTSGARDSLAPPNIPVGRVANVIGGTTAAGPRLEVQPLADLDRLNFVVVVLYAPGVEAPAEPGG